jgi:hypothetical protein
MEIATSQWHDFTNIKAKPFLPLTDSRFRGAAPPQPLIGARKPSTQFAESVAAAFQDCCPESHESRQKNRTVLAAVVHCQKEMVEESSKG